jgi:hypothetical protein
MISFYAVFLHDQFLLTLCFFMISFYAVFLHDQFLHCAPSWSVLILLVLHDQFLHCVPSWSVPKFVFLPVPGQLLHSWSFMIRSYTRVLLRSVLSSCIPASHGQFVHSCSFMINSFTVFLHDQFLHSWSFMISYTLGPSWSVLTVRSFMIGSSYTHCVPSWSGVLTLFSFMISSYSVFLHDQFLRCAPSWSVLTPWSFVISSYTLVLHDQFLQCVPSWSAVLTLCSFMISSSYTVLFQAYIRRDRLHRG